MTSQQIRVNFAVNSRIVNRSELERVVERARSEDKRIVFANGCFDLLHAGHVRYLEAAKALGDILIVAVNSDEQPTSLKPECRPPFPHDQPPHIASALL